MDFLGRGGGFLFVLLVGDSFFEVVIIFPRVVLCCRSISRRFEFKALVCLIYSSQV